MSETDPLAVIVVTYNSKDLLVDLVASLRPGCDPIPFQLIVVDNDSSDHSLDEVVRLAPSATTVQMGRNAGYAAAINAGVAMAGPYSAILILNPDIRLGVGCVQQLMAALATDGTGITVPRISNGSGSMSRSLRREPSVSRALGDALIGANRAGKFEHFGEIISDVSLYRDERTAAWAEGSVQLISPQCWTTCGPWEESFFLYSEETDFDLRAKDAGFTTRFVPGATATHLGGESGTSPPLWALLTANRIRLYRRRHGLLRTVPYWGIAVLRESSRAILGQKISRASLRALFTPARLRALPVLAAPEDNAYLNGP